MALKNQKERLTADSAPLWQRRWVRIVGVVVAIVLACLVIETVLGSGASSKAISPSNGASVSHHQIAAQTPGGAGVGATERER